MLQLWPRAADTKGVETATLIGWSRVARLTAAGFALLTLVTLALNA